MDASWQQVQNSFSIYFFFIGSTSLAACSLEVAGAVHIARQQALRQLNIDIQILSEILQHTSDILATAMSWGQSRTCPGASTCVLQRAHSSAVQCLHAAFLAALQMSSGLIAAEILMLRENTLLQRFDV